MLSLINFYLPAKHTKDTKKYFFYFRVFRVFRGQNIFLNRQICLNFPTETVVISRAPERCAGKIIKTAVCQIENNGHFKSRPMFDRRRRINILCKFCRNICGNRYCKTKRRRKKSVGQSWTFIRFGKLKRRARKCLQNADIQIRNFGKREKIFGNPEFRQLKPRTMRRIFEIMRLIFFRRHRIIPVCRKLLRNLSEP